MSKKCQPVWKDLEEMKPEEIAVGYCPTKSTKMKLVGCLSVKYRNEEGLDFGDSVRKAWKKVKEICP